MPTNRSSQSTGPSAPTSSTSNDQTRQQRSSGSATRPSRTSLAAAAAPTSLWWSHQTIHFSVNVWVFVVAVLGVFPLVPTSLSNGGYKLALIGTACSSLYSLYSLYGKPREWNLQALQVWFQSVIATKDFIYFVYCLPFITTQLTLKSALLPVLCRSLEHIAKFLRCNFSHSSLYRKYMEEFCVSVESNTATLGILSSQAEIGIGFLLIISLVSCQRNIIQTFIYWQLLKLMYHVPVTGGYHRSVWATIRRTVVPFVHRYVPFLDMPISAVQSWWLR
ncbi:Bifunctional dihydroflavonol 4-reductase/flavanone 4-reductase [Heracleum sosnowskyi]|uniref:Bifunctional dihydroflavonol 4-reductase/flavanone 4-reductase n=1 Tax=Heracleum sosnowskyi TaxID=360622 RepID=A0AAD8M8H9_9APIA|nr:Bifunctional dihydroflavonol 4-reductase/flavanone 4-reductase [Heracleum sosnowskyi]